MDTTVETAAQLGLRPDEFDRICGILGRTPNFTELAAYSVMWSEHCSYKNSIRWLKTLPRDGGRLLVAAGEENAGLADIGDGLGVVFKIESHNHPSAIEPFQGAATGVGGIHRDIFTMGARPIAALNSLRFGDLSDPRTRHLLGGVVHGIGHYGNCFGVPTVGGEVYFESCYHTNPLVNAMSVGVVELGKTVSATAEGIGNPVFIVGSATGKDGIGGASFASADITEDSARDLPAVQVGDPFQEKKLLEACLEVIPTGALAGMQDMGAAGIICSTAETSAKGGVGMRIDLDRVPTRQRHMKAWELLLSESQERMLMIVHKGREQEVIDIFAKWDLPCSEIGTVTDDGMLRFHMHGVEEAVIPADSLVLGGGAPVYEREYREPDYLAQVRAFNPAQVPVPNDLRPVADFLTRLPNIASKRWVYEQYDSMVGTANTSTNTPSDAPVVWVKGTTKGLAMTTDCNSRYVHADPYRGAMIAVFEAARNIVCSGGEPLGVTNCLNFGNPYDPGVYYQFVHAIQGMGEACRLLGTPVTGGNVSFYNQNPDGAVYPTPTIGMVGLLEDVEARMGLAFQGPGDIIYLLGPVSDDIGSSEYLHKWQRVELSPAPRFDPMAEIDLHRSVARLIRNRAIRSAHDLSEGGLFICLLESAMAGTTGFTALRPADGPRADAFWFGEAQGRVAVTISPDTAAAFEAGMSADKVPFLRIGAVTAGRIEVDGADWGGIAEWKAAYDQAIGTRMEAYPSE
jgi:phosphoribosylformylglycinamidine synthase